MAEVDFVHPRIGIISKNNRILSVSFDIDGTIIDSLLAQYNWFNFWSNTYPDLIPDHGLTVSIPQDLEEFRLRYNRSHLEGGLKALYEEFGLAYGDNPQVHPVWKEFEKYKIANPPPLFPGIEQTIDKIWREGAMHNTENFPDIQRLKLVIHTQNTWPSVYAAIEQITPYFETRSDAEYVRELNGGIKPGGGGKPQIGISHLLNRIGIELCPWQHCHIGDTFDDLITQKTYNPLTGEEHRIITIGAAWGGFNNVAELSNGAHNYKNEHMHFDFILNDHNHLPAVIRWLRYGKVKCNADFDVLHNSTSHLG